MLGNVFTTHYIGFRQQVDVELIALDLRRGAWWRNGRSLYWTRGGASHVINGITCQVKRSGEFKIAFLTVILANKNNYKYMNTDFKILKPFKLCDF